MKLFIIISGIILFGINCKQVPNPKLSEFELIALGIVENEDSLGDVSSQPGYILTILAKSKERLAIETSTRTFNIVPFRSSGYLGFRSQEPQANEFHSKYVAYRLSEYIDNLDYDYLYRTYNDFADINKKTSQFNIICSIERNYLLYFLADSLKARQYLSALEIDLKDIPKSKRIKFLLAKIYQAEKNYEKAIVLYKDLLESDYYAFLSLRNLINICIIHNPDSLDYYKRLASIKFRGRCIPEIWNTDVKKSFELNSELLNDCISSTSQRDSMKALLYLGGTYLDLQKFSEFDSLYSEFSINNSEFLLDSFKTWEKGEYYDLKLRSLFLQNRYKELIKFITTSVGYNRKISVGSALELKKLIRQYYFEYNLDASDNRFESFFAKKFTPLVYEIPRRQT